jgi:formylglycine-generating enzyme required for sulfatase activity
MDADGSTVIGIQAVEGGGLAYEPSPPSLPALESLYYAVIPVNLNFDGWYLYKNAKWDFNTEITANITLTARWAEGGSFTMGSPSNEPDRYSDEARHFVTLTKGLYMGKYPVTQELYHAVMGTNPSHFSTANGRAPLSGESADKRPAEKVSWYDALVFCNTLSMLEGFSPVYNIHGSTDPSAWGEMPAGSTHPNCAAWNAASIINGADGYRLPTEAEWEYVCRAGTDTAYNTGETISNNTGWYSGNSGGSSVGTHEVGKKSANNWGFFDMSGNVKEWCWDWYGADYCAAADADRDPTGPASSDGDRVIRSGSWNMGAHSLRSAYRDYNYPWSKINSIGFRIARYPFAGLGNRSAP